MAAAAAAFILPFKDSNEFNFGTWSTALSLHFLQHTTLPAQAQVSW